MLGISDHVLHRFCAAIFLSAGFLHAGESWWAFQPLKQPADGRASIDSFIQAALAKKGLQASPRADRRTLIRRASFDLTGLPPAPAEVEAFVKDPSPDAYARLIERLLASPHYGEHWARHWLDIARYSDTKGYVYAREEKQFVGAAPYRDWVVRALNEDMPYDQFLRLQIAADQLAPPGSPDLAAMGYLTLGRRFLGVTHDIIDDRIDVLTRGMLGLTVACARCHDHKHDPIPTRDYYALYGVFQSCAEKVVPCANLEQADRGFLRELQVRETRLKNAMRMRRTEQSRLVRKNITAYLLAQLELDKFPEENFGQILGKDDLNPVFVRRWQQHLAATAAKTSQDPIFSAWHAFAAIPAGEFVRLSAQAAQGLHVGNSHVARAFATPPASMHEVARRYGALFTSIEEDWRAAEKYQPDLEWQMDDDAHAIHDLLHRENSPCWVPDEHIANNEMYFSTGVVVELWKLQGEVDRWVMQADMAAPHATVLVDRAAPSTPRVFKRGNPLTKAEEVPRQFLQVLTGGAENARPFTRGSGRLELAHAVTDPANPLTARVMVNRVWAHHFGRGLVSTPSDFGKRAEHPSHPELLDWLALHFIQTGWSLKDLHRLILLSQAWQQASGGPESLAGLKKAQEVDADNRLLWRMNPHRLSFEEARDAWLCATGELDPRMGGRPAGLFDAGNRRRTLYVFVDRDLLPPVLRTFDFANPDLSISQRTETTVPQQALFGLNHPFVAGRAKVLAGRLASGGSMSPDAPRVRELYSRLYQREPSAGEMHAALEFVQAGSPPAARSLLPDAWLYGYGEWDEDRGSIKDFKRLPHFNGSAWQGGGQWPDRITGWAQLTAAGGHPGNDRRHAVVRRWVAPLESVYTIRSTVMHEPAAGDGIRAFISHGTRGLLRSAVVHDGAETLDLEELFLKKGDCLDFVVDIRDTLNSDQFLWAPTITAAGSAGSGGDIPEQKWDAEKDFKGETVPLLDPWEQLAQVLMLANEFVFVD